MPKHGEKFEQNIPDFKDIGRERQDLRDQHRSLKGAPFEQAGESEHAESELLEAIKHGDATAVDALSMPEAGEDQLRHTRSALKEAYERTSDFHKYTDPETLTRTPEHEQLRRDHKTWKNYEPTAALLEALRNKEDDFTREEFEISLGKDKLGAVEKQRLKELATLKHAIEERRQELTHNPETALPCRMAELDRYREELNEGFAFTPSVQEDANWILEKWAKGQAVLLEGPTGTGKTEMSRALSRKVYGTSPQVIRCQERTGPPEIFGRNLLRATDADDAKVLEVNEKIKIALQDFTQHNPGANTEQYSDENHRLTELFKQTIGVTTETYFQPGRYVDAIDQGVPLIFDEFNNLPTNMRFAMKELYNRKAGDSVIIQEDSGKPHEIQKGFAWAATANIKSAKHKERFELDPAESRVFQMRHIDYLPPHELYDVCLAKLMDAEGRVDVSRHEAETVLKNFCDAATVIQTAYDKEIEQHYRPGARGEKPKLAKAVLDPGQVLNMLSGFSTARAQGIGLKRHLEKGLMDFLDKRDYPDSDRDLVARILVTKGFFSDTVAKDFDIPGFDEQTLRGLRPNRSETAKADEQEAEQSKTRARLSLKQLAELDPYGIRQLAHEAEGQDLLTGAPERSGEILGDLTIRATHRYQEGGQEKEDHIELDCEKSVAEFQKFYENHEIEVPEDFADKMREIWQRSEAEIREAIEQNGFDEILLIPREVGHNLSALHEKMSKDYGETFLSNNFKEGGGFGGAKENKQADRLVLLHKNRAQNLSDRSELKVTQGKTAQHFIDRGEDLNLTDYLVFQRKYFEETQNHLDEFDWTWLPGTKSGARVVAACWYPAYGRLCVLARDPDLADGALGCRLSRSFF